MITIWTQYGAEGWQPNDFKTKEEAIQAILKGLHFGPIRVTEDLGLVLTKGKFLEVNLPDVDLPHVSWRTLSRELEACLECSKVFHSNFSLRACSDHANLEEA